MSFVRLYGILGFPDVSVVKNLPINAGDAGNMGLTPGSGIPPGGGNYNPPQYFNLENHMKTGVWQATVYRIAKSQT